MTFHFVVLPVTYMYIFVVLPVTYLIVMFVGDIHVLMIDGDVPFCSA